MLSYDEHPGIVTFLVGLVVLVMVAVGLSVVMEKRLAFSSGFVRVKRDVRAAGQESKDLKVRLARANERLDSLEGPRARDAAALRQAKKSLAESRQRMDVLVTSRDSLAAAIPLIEEAFASYRLDFRTRTRAAAEGEEIGTLALRGGRSYQQVSITKVTDVGLEIRHEHGFARIQAPDLAPEWQERFQWDDEERRNRLAEEARALKSMPVLVADPIRKAPEARKPLSAIPNPPLVPAAVDPDKISALRFQFSGWKSKVDRLTTDRNEAVAKSSHQTSVPGQLETWKARATRFGAELTKARIELAAARARLAASAPNDPLLQLRADDRE